MGDFFTAAYEVCANYLPTVLELGAGLMVANFGRKAIGSFMFQVDQQNEAIVENWGKFSRVVGPGLHFKLPSPIGRVATKTNLRLMQSDFKMEFRTSDNAFVTVPVSLHHRVTDTRKAYYELGNPVGQMESFASNVVRAKGSKMTLAQMYEAQDDIKDAIKATLDEKIGKFGFAIEDVVVSQPQPREEVKAAFDRVISSQRGLEAAKNEAEAAKIKTVKAAEGEAEAMKAYGRGIADQRLEIARGFKEAIENMTGEGGLSPEQSLALMVMTNGQEAIVKAAANKGTVIVGSTNGDAALDGFKDLEARMRVLANARPHAEQRAAA